MALAQAAPEATGLDGFSNGAECPALESTVVKKKKVVKKRKASVDFLSQEELVAAQLAMMEKQVELMSSGRQLVGEEATRHQALLDSMATVKEHLRLLQEAHAEQERAKQQHALELQQEQLLQQQQQQQQQQQHPLDHPPANHEQPEETLDSFFSQLQPRQQQQHPLDSSFAPRQQSPEEASANSSFPQLLQSPQQPLGGSVKSNSKNHSCAQLLQPQPSHTMASTFSFLDTPASTTLSACSSTPPFHRQDTADPPMSPSEDAASAAPVQPVPQTTICPASPAAASPAATQKKKLKKKKLLSASPATSGVPSESPATHPAMSPVMSPAACSPANLHSNHAAINPAFMNAFPTSPSTRCPAPLVASSPVAPHHSGNSLTPMRGNHSELDSPLPSQGSHHNHNNNSSTNANSGRKPLTLQRTSSHDNYDTSAADMFAGMSGAMSGGRKSTPSGSPCSSLATSPPPFPHFTRANSGPHVAEPTGREGGYRNSVCSVNSCLSPEASERSMSPTPGGGERRKKKVVKKSASRRASCASPVLSVAPPPPPPPADDEPPRVSQRAVLQGLWETRKGKQIEVIGTELHFLISGKRVHLKEFPSGLVELHGVKLDKAARDGSEVIWCDGDVWTRSSREGTFEPISLAMLR
ncbi:hypothetical protein DIPPA_00129 [Diplonema papillatum]|nr:hypothetical protein DIPPA_00129 [Diplonema papillatum]